MTRLFFKTKLFSPLGLLFIISSIAQLGVNLFTILKIASKLYPNKIAICSENKSYSYREIYEKTNKLRFILHDKYSLKKKQKIAFFCANSPSFILSLFASAGLGLDIYLLSYETNEEQFELNINTHHFDFIIYDASLESCVLKANVKHKAIESSIILDEIKTEHITKRKIERHSFNKLVVLTSGTTGISLPVPRRASTSTYLRPFISISKKLKIWEYNSLYVATPIYHGFGFVALLMSFALGKEVHIREKFNSKDICKTIEENEIEVATVVPTILQRMLQQNPSSIKSLKCIISGGAYLSSQLIRDVQKAIGNCIFNMYGTTEAGVCIMATPSDLEHANETIGKPLKGVAVKITNDEGMEVPPLVTGQISIRCAWSVSPNKWIATGDMGYIDKYGYYYLMGRVDDMIVSGGKNVYPSELENILRKHSQIKDVVVKGIDDYEFGKRLKAFIVLEEDSTLTEAHLFEWLSQQAARYQMPREIKIIDSIPLNLIQKIDKKQLS